MGRRHREQAGAPAVGQTDADVWAADCRLRIGGCRTADWRPESAVKRTGRLDAWGRGRDSGRGTWIRFRMDVEVEEVADAEVGVDVDVEVLCAGVLVCCVLWALVSKRRPTPISH